MPGELIAASAICVKEGVPVKILPEILSEMRSFLFSSMVVSNSIIMEI
jgi:hypothetical protein